MKKSSPNSASGFTLVEMSIVLIIIGLITSGIILGKDLVKSAEIKKSIAELHKIRTAINLFSDKYDAIPGDMKDASQYWPGLTSDGSGNRHFTVNDPPKNEEGGYLWHHLGLAEMYGSFSRPDNSNFSYKYGVNTPEIFPHTAATGQYRGAGSGSPNNRYEIQHNYIQVGTWEDSGSASDISCPAVDTLTALAIDKKIDDGNASRGSVLSYKGTCATAGPTCTDWTGAGADYDQPKGAANYDVANPEHKCRMAFALFND